MLVLELDASDVAVIDRGHMDALAAKEAGGIAHALGRVMVAGDDDDPHARLGQALEKPIHERHGLGAGRGLVIQVPRNEHRIDPALAHEVHHLREHVALVLEHGKFADALADVQVRYVKKPHRASLQTGRPAFVVVCTRF